MFLFLKRVGKIRDFILEINKLTKRLTWLTIMDFSTKEVLKKLKK